MKTLIPIAAALALAACNPTTTDGGLGPLPSDQDRTEEPREGEPAQRPGEPAAGGEQAENPPFDQSETPEDVRLTAEIRRAVLDAEGMSALADNVQIVTRSGMVRLTGTVETQEEKQEIERIARGVSGVRDVDNQIQVGPADAEQGEVPEPGGGLEPGP